MTKWNSSKRQQDLLTLPYEEIASKYKIGVGYARNLQKQALKQMIRRIEAMEKAHGGELGQEQLDELERVKELLQDFKDHGIPVSPEDAPNVKSIKIWQTSYKDADGEGRQLINRAVELTGTETGFEQEVIRQVPPIKIVPAKTTRRKSKDKTAIIVPDLQGGYRRHGEELEPIHDESVVDVGLQIIRHAQPDLIVLNGDNLDFPDLSRFPADSTHFQQVLQPTLDRVYEILATMRASAPDSRIVWLEGNHEKRLNKQILKHNLHLWGLKRPGGDEDFSWLSIPHLMNLAGIEVEYVSGYPANTFRINDRLQAIHGHKVRSSGSTAELYSREEELSTIFGHVHRMEMHARTNRLGKTVTALSFGTWARTDGAVPSYNNGVTDEGQVVPRQENWQNGMGVIEYRDGDSPFQWHAVAINPQDEYETHWDGKVFKPNGIK